MLPPKPTDKGIVVYREYFSSLTPEYISIFRGNVVCSVDPDKNLCVDGGIRLKSVDELVRMTTLILDPIIESGREWDYQRHHLNGTNFKKAVNILNKPKRN
jgi:hypothetical protein